MQKLITYFNPNMHNEYTYIRTIGYNLSGKIILIFEGKQKSKIILGKLSHCMQDDMKPDMLAINE